MSPDYQVEVYAAVSDIATEEWYSLVHSHQDLAMDLRLIHLLETTLNDQARFWTVMVRNQQRQLMACACLSLFLVDAMQSTTGFMQTVVQQVRRYWPNALKQKVLFCGLPLPSGHSHLRMHDAADVSAVLKCLNQTMIDIARREQAQLLVFKELNADQARQIEHLQTLGYIRGELEPIFLLSRPFKNFNEYKAALRSSYKHQINANIKKFNAFGFQVEHFFHAEEIGAQFTETLHQLYLNVWSKAKEKLECFPLDFFQQLPKALPGQVALTVIKDQQKPIAFAVGVIEENIYHNLYIGLDYSYVKRADLYFNLFYLELDAVFPLGKQKIFLGQTSAAFKSRLGACADARFFWVRPLSPLLRFIFKRLQRFIFPKLPARALNQVFKENSSTT